MDISVYIPEIYTLIVCIHTHANTHNTYTHTNTRIRTCLKTWRCEVLCPHTLTTK